MKLNWGFGIAVVALAFVAFILSLVWRCSNEDVQLVSDAYYENELRYQDRIDRRTNAVEAGMLVAVEQRKDTICLAFPSKVRSDETEGTVVFYKPDNSKLDFTLPLMVDSSASQIISVADLCRGRWQLQITWNSSGVPYYQEREIWIN